VLAIHTYVFFPFFFLLVSSALQQKDVSLGEASRSMGMGALRTFLRIELPMLTPALYGAALMVFMASMASFSAPLLFDIQGPYLSTRIYNLKTQDLWGEAYATTTLFMCSSLGVLVLFRYLRGNQRYQPVGKGLPQRKRVTNDSDRTFLCFYRLKKIAVTGGAMIILLILLLPHLGILLWSLTQDGTWTYQLLPPQYTLDNYAKILGLGSHSTEIWRPVQNSLWMAGTATLANLLFALAAAYVLKGKGVGNKTLTDLLVMLPWALPGTALAINLLATFSHHTPLALGIQLANTVWLLPLAYFIRNIPLVVRPLVAVWEQSGDELEEAARSLGAGRMRTFRTIWIPLGLTALAGGGLMAFVSALGEFISSAILFIPANKPIAMAIYGEFQSGSYGLCSAYGILLILMIAVVMVWGGRSLQRSWGG
jgi:iron(III) transport system permease protein